MAVAACTFFSHDTARGSLRPPVLTCLRELQAQPKKTSNPSIVYGESADAFKTADFASAVVRAGDVTPGKTNPPGTIIYHHAGL